MENDSTYKTIDFYISSILLASKKLKLTKLEKRTANLVTFVFYDPYHLANKIIKDHWDRKNRTPTLDLIEAINQLKTRIHSGI